jgi:Uncharacterised nucleotidyltransferase
MPYPAGGSAEADVILCCARTRLDGATGARLRTALQRDIDWEQVLRTAELQKVTPLLHAHLSRLQPEHLPPPVAEELRRRARGIARLNLVLVAELQRVLALLEQHGIPAVAFKGAAVALSAYGNLGLRQFGDLDILVRRPDMRKAQELLAQLGYRLDQQERGWEYHLVDDRRQLTIDLHERLAPRYYPVVADFESLRSRLTPLPAGGGIVPTLPAEDSLLVLSIHLVKDCREWKETLSQVCDIAELVRAHPPDWDRVLARAASLGGERVFLIALWLARELLDLPLPPVVEARLRADRVPARLGGRVERRLRHSLAGSLEYAKYRRDVWRTDSGFHLQSRERTADKLRYLGFIARDRMRMLLEPSERDRQFIALPRAMGFLYYLIRPVRVARDKLLPGRAGTTWSPTPTREPGSIS